MRATIHNATIIDEDSLAGALAELRTISPLIGRLLETYGNPPAWRREPGFASLVYTILEQQVSLASARAVYERLLVTVGVLTPARFRTVSDKTLRDIGFSRQKTEYCRNLAELVETREINLEALTDAADETVRRILTDIRGIGPWTADIYLLHSLGRPDIWPTGDLALRIAVQEELDHSEQPNEQELQEIGAEFRPWRSVAARVFWHGYLTRRGIVEVT